MANRAELIEEIIKSIHAIKHKAAQYNQSISDDTRISLSQLIVLHIASRHEGAGIKDIAGKLGITSSAVTQLVDVLARKGYMKREGSPDDRRALKISLSDEGKKKIRTLRMRGLKELSGVFDVLDDDELEKYCELNKKIVDRILSSLQVK